MEIVMELNTFIQNAIKMTNNEKELIKYYFEFVRDQVLFDFLPEIDDIGAEEVFKRRRGQCNNKTVLLFELLTRSDIKAKVNFSTIKKSIHRGLFPSVMYLATPKEIGHSWIEVLVDDMWIKLDGYINDKELFYSALNLNKSKGWKIGHSVAIGDCGASLEFSLKNDKFVQMDGVISDLGLTTRPLEFLRSSNNPNKVNFIKKLMYKLFLPLIRSNVERVRNST